MKDRLFINGEWVASDSDEMFDLADPCPGRAMGMTKRSEWRPSLGAAALIRGQS